MPPRDEVEKLALEDDNVQRFTTDATIRKIIVVPGRLVNIVANKPPATDNQLGSKL